MILVHMWMYVVEQRVSISNTVHSVDCGNSAKSFVKGIPHQ